MSQHCTEISEGCMYFRGDFQRNVASPYILIQHEHRPMNKVGSPLDFWLAASWAVDKRTEICKWFYDFHLISLNSGMLSIFIKVAKIRYCIFVLAQLMVKPRRRASISITSSARRSTDNISARRATSSAKSKSVKDSFFLPMVVPNMLRWTVCSMNQSIGTRKRSVATLQPYLTPIWIRNHSELQPSTRMQLLVPV